MDFKSRIPCPQKNQKSNIPTSYLSARKLSQGSDTGLCFGGRAFRGSTSYQSASINRNSMFSGQKAVYSISSSTRKSTARPGIGLFAFTPQQPRISLNFGTNSAQSSRRSSVIGNRRFVKDNRRLNDRDYHQQCITKIIEYLTANGYRHPISKTFLKSMSSAEITHVFEFLFSIFDPKWKVTPLDAEVPKLLKLVGYPFQVNKSCIVSAASNNARGQLLGIFEWLVDIVNYTQKLNVEQILFPSNFEEINPKRELLKLCLSSNCDAEQVQQFNLSMATEKFGNEKALENLLHVQDKLEKEIELIQEEIENQKQIPNALRDIQKELDNYQKYIEDMKEHISKNRENLVEIEKSLQAKVVEKADLEIQLKSIEEDVKQQKYDLNDIKYERDRQKQVEIAFHKEKQEVDELKNEIRGLKLELKRRKDILRKLNVDANSCLTGLRDVACSAPVQPYAEPLMTFFSDCDWQKVSSDLLAIPPESEAAVKLREKLASIVHQLKVLIAEQTAALQVKALLNEEQNIHDIDLKIEECQNKVQQQKNEIQKLSTELSDIRKLHANEWTSMKSEGIENQQKFAELEIKVRRLQEKMSDRLKNLKRELENKVIVYKEEEQLALLDFKKQSKNVTDKLTTITNIVGVSMKEYTANSKLHKEDIASNERKLQSFIEDRSKRKKKNKRVMAD